MQPTTTQPTQNRYVSRMREEFPNNETMDDITLAKIVRAKHFPDETESDFLTHIGLQDKTKTEIKKDVAFEPFVEEEQVQKEPNPLMQHLRQKYDMYKDIDDYTLAKAAKAVHKPELDDAKYYNDLGLDDKFKEERDKAEVQKQVRIAENRPTVNTGIDFIDNNLVNDFTLGAGKNLLDYGASAVKGVGKIGGALGFDEFEAKSKVAQAKLNKGSERADKSINNEYVALAGEMLGDPVNLLPAGIFTQGAKAARVAKSMAGGTVVGGTTMAAKNYGNDVMTQEDKNLEMGIGAGFVSALNGIIAGVTKGRVTSAISDVPDLEAMRKNPEAYGVTPEEAEQVAVTAQEHLKATKQPKASEELGIAKQPTEQPSELDQIDNGFKALADEIMPNKENEIVPHGMNEPKEIVPEQATPKPELSKQQQLLNAEAEAKNNLRIAEHRHRIDQPMEAAVFETQAQQHLDEAQRLRDEIAKEAESVPAQSNIPEQTPEPIIEKPRIGEPEPEAKVEDKTYWDNADSVAKQKYGMYNKLKEEGAEPHILKYNLEKVLDNVNYSDDYSVISQKADELLTKSDEEVKAFIEPLLNPHAKPEAKVDVTAIAETPDAAPFTELLQHPRLEELLTKQQDVLAKDNLYPNKLIQAGAGRELSGNGGTTKHAYDPAQYEKNHGYDFMLTKQDVKNIRAGKIDENIASKLENDLGVLDNHPDWADVKTLDNPENAVDDFGNTTLFAKGADNLAAGTIAGIEQDENGNFSFDAEKFIIGLGGYTAVKAALKNKTVQGKLKEYAQKAVDTVDMNPQVHKESGFNAMFVGAKGDEVGAFSDTATQKLMKEIDDSKATIKIDKLTDLTKYGGEKGTYSDRDNFGALTLSDILEHKELFDNFPHLKDVKVKGVIIDGTLPITTKGTYNPIDNSISINANNIDDMKKTLLHEIQHSVQTKEGWAKGGSVNEFRADNIDEIRQNLKGIEIAKLLKDPKNPIAYIEDLTGVKVSDDVIEMSRNWTVKELDDEATRLRVYDDPMQSYRSLHGEQQARATQYRANMTPEQRAGESMWDTLKREEGYVPESIVKYGDEIVYNIEDSHKNSSFGQVYTNFRNDYKSAKETLLEKKSGDAIGALQHKELGDIDLVYGVEGSGKSDGMGLAKIAKYHPEILDNLDEIIYDMPIVKRSKNRIKLESENHFVSVRLDYDGVTKHWLLTAFEKNGDAPTNRTNTGQTLAEADGMTTPSSNKIIPQEVQSSDELFIPNSKFSTAKDTADKSYRPLKQTIAMDGGDRIVGVQKEAPDILVIRDKNGEYATIDKKYLDIKTAEDGVQTVSYKGASDETNPNILMANGSNSFGGGLGGGIIGGMEDTDGNYVPDSWNWRNAAIGAMAGMGVGHFAKGEGTGMFGGKAFTTTYNKFKAGKLPNASALPDETIAQLSQRKLQDKFNRVKQLINVKADINKIDDAMNPYQAEELMHGRVEDKIRELETKTVTPILEKISKAKLTTDKVDEYLWARHAPERNAKMLENHGKENGSGMSDAEAYTIISRYANNQAIQDIANDVYKMNRDRLKYIHSEGLESEDFIMMLDANYDNYVPLRREFADKESFFNTGKGFDIRGKETMRAVGSDRKVESPLMHSILAYEETIVRSEKNQVGKAFLEFTKEFPDESLYSVKGVKHLPEQDASGAVVGMSPSYKTDDNVFHVKVDGKVQEITIHDPALAAAFKNLNSQQMNSLLLASQKAVRVIAGLSTSYNPEFVVTNFTRDIQTAMINMPDGMKASRATIIKDVPFAMQGIYSSLRDGSKNEWSTLFEEMRKEGGTTGWHDLHGVLDMKKSTQAIIDKYEGKVAPVQAFKEVLNYIDDVNGAVENASRLVAYKMAKDSGKTNKQAASIAKNLTVNFNRKGEMGAGLNALYMFYNASIQGSTRMVQQLAKSRTSQALVAGIAITGVVLDMWNRSQNAEAYAVIDDYIKDTNYIFMHKNGTYNSLKLPYGYNIFKAAGDLASKMYHGEMEASKIPKRILSMTVNAFSPIGVDSESVAHTFAPTVVKPFVEIDQNKNHFGGKIAPVQNPFESEKPDSQNHFKSVNPLAKAIAQNMNEWTGGNMYEKGGIDVSPESIEHLVGFATGGLGQLVMRTGTVADQGLDKDKKVDMNKVPFLRNVYGVPREKAETNILYKMYKESGANTFSEVERNRYIKWTDAALEKQDINKDQAKKLKSVFTDNQRRLDFANKYNLQNKEKYQNSETLQDAGRNEGLTKQQRKELLKVDK